MVIGVGGQLTLSGLVRTLSRTVPAAPRTALSAASVDTRRAGVCPRSLPVLWEMDASIGVRFLPVDPSPEAVKRMADVGKGLFVVAIDAHLHGERKVPGIFPPGKNLGRLGTDYSIWVHQSAVSHTARDVSKILDALSARPEVDLSRIGVAGVSMGSSTCLVLAWREPRISVVVGLIGAVDFWY